MAADSAVGRPRVLKCLDAEVDPDRPCSVAPRCRDHRDGLRTAVERVDLFVVVTHVVGSRRWTNVRSLTSQPSRSSSDPFRSYTRPCSPTEAGPTAGRQHEQPLGPVSCRIRFIASKIDPPLRGLLLVRAEADVLDRREADDRVELTLMLPVLDPRRRPRRTARARADSAGDRRRSRGSRASPARGRACSRSLRRRAPCRRPRCRQSARKTYGTSTTRSLTHRISTLPGA